ncbi:MAG: peptide chain release factor N(5)-glutamine methyltransferase [Chloroflexota bacterium]|jgi:release factor glutamine methyltransferase
MDDPPLTIRAALAYGRGQLQASDSPALNARLLLEHVLQVNHTYLIAHDDRQLAKHQAATYRRLVRRAALREPIPYLTGWAPFYGRRFKVSPSVLIPRPDTEFLVERAVDWIKNGPGAASPGVEGGPLMVDVGTGSGCVAITLALESGVGQIEAVDISPAALAVARHNAEHFDVSQRITFHQGSLLAPVSGRPDLIVANPPYIADPEWTTIDDGIKWYEPDIALKGGPDGLAVVRQLLAEAAQRVAPGGAILCEIGWQQGSAARELAGLFFPQATVDILTDCGGRDRLLAIQTAG